MEPKPTYNIWLAMMIARRNDMETVDFLDRHLDPPDYPTRSDCDGCGVEYDNGDLTKVDGQWYCDDCLDDMLEGL